jgi:hypothetical protein
VLDTGDGDDDVTAVDLQPAQALYVSAALMRPVVNSSGAGRPDGAPIRPRQSVAQLLGAKNARPMQSLDELAADTFESDQGLEKFLAFTYSERHRDLA